MENFEFKSAICTSVEQSKRLLALGLKKETADMVYHYQKSRIETMQWELRPHPPTLRHTTHLNVDKLNVFKHKRPDGSIMTGEEYFEELWGQDIPAWSLHRLLFLYNQDYTIKELYNGEEVYDMLICAIQIAIEDGEFNEEYLKTDK